MNEQRLSLYDIEWQCLRVQLLGNWDTLEKVNDNLDRLDAYIQPDVDTSTETYITRLYQVLNLLDAVRMGYSGQGVSLSKEDIEVMGYRDIVQAKYYKIRSRHPGPAHFVVPTREQIIQDMRDIPRELAHKIYDNLRNRRRLALSKIKFGTQETKERLLAKNRPELLWALDAMEEALYCKDGKERKVRQ